VALSEGARQTLDRPTPLRIGATAERDVERVWAP